MCFSNSRSRSGSGLCPDVLEVCCGIPPNAKNSSKEETGVIQVQKPSNKRICGIRNINGIDFKITGDIDNEAEYGEFPWMVQIISKNHYLSVNNTVALCGGSLLTPLVILTEAHCVHL